MTGANFYTYLLSTFKRTDKSVEAFDAITDTVRDMKRQFAWDESKIDKDTSVGISVLGTYKIPVEADMGLFMGDVILRDGTNSYTLKKRSKEDWDVRYPNPDASSVLRGRPRDWCWFAGNILIGPVPDRTSYLYHLSYSADDGVAIVTGTPVVPFSDSYRECLRQGSLMRLYYQLENDEQGAKYERAYENSLVLAKRREKQNTGTPGATYYSGV